MIDEKDYKILEILRQNSRTKVRNIAKKLKIPITTVHKRIRKMEEDEIIKGYFTNVDYEKLGYSITSYVFVKADYARLKKQKLDQTFMIKNILRNFPKISIASLVTGYDRDIILRLRVKSIPELNTMLENLRGLEGVLSTETLIVLGEAKQIGAIR